MTNTMFTPDGKPVTKDDLPDFLIDDKEESEGNNNPESTTDDMNDSRSDDSSGEDNRSGETTTVSDSDIYSGLAGIPIANGGRGEDTTISTDERDESETDDSDSWYDPQY